MHRSRIIPALLALGVTITLLFAVINLQVIAQDNPTPTPSIEDWYLQSPTEWDLPYAVPGTTVGEAEWTFKDSSFTSNYPDGFSFSVKAYSSTGDITVASVIFSHTPYQLHRIETQNIDTNLITLEWEHEESLPPWVAVNYYWSFIDSEGNRYRSDWILGNEYVDNTDEWTRVESDDVVILLQDGLSPYAIDLTVEAMDTQHDTFVQAWGGTLPYKPRVILFASEADFQQWRRSFFSGPGIIGETNDEWGATVQVVSDDNLFDLAYGTVLHEVGHLYQFAYAPEAFPAGSWFTEGSATLFELNQQYDYEERVRNLAITGALPLLLQGNGPLVQGVGPDGLGRYGYDVGYTFWKWLVINFGLETHQELITALSTGMDRNTALEFVLGMSIDQIEYEWALWVGADSPAATLVPTWTPPPFRPTVTPFQFPSSN